MLETGRRGEALHALRAREEVLLFWRFPAPAPFLDYLETDDEVGWRGGQEGRRRQTLYI
jgi:hypothetical protein